MGDTIPQDRIKEAREMLDKLYEGFEHTGLDAEEQSIFDVLSWLLDDTDKPEID